MRTQAVALFALIPLLACDNGSPTAPDDSVVLMESLVNTSTSGYFTGRKATLRDDGEWAEAWRTLHAGQSPVPALPVVDFAREAVLLAAAGERNNGCYSIEMSGARLTGGGTLEVEVYETVPGPTCVCTEALVRPAHAVRISATSAAAVFVDRVRELVC